MSARLEVRGLGLELGGRPVLEGLSFTLEGPSFVALLGPNGAGKSSLLRCLFGALLPSAGEILLDGRPLLARGRRALARRVAVLRADDSAQGELSVRAMVQLGRAPHLGAFARPGPEDEAAVERALVRTGLAGMAARRLRTLSSGERQRVLLARALAQRPAVLLLDEPTSHLDVRHALEVLEQVASEGLTVLAAIHDLNLALRFADRALLLSAGRLAAEGAASTVLSAGRLSEVFGVPLATLPGPDGRPVLCVARGAAVEGGPPTGL